MRHGYPKGSGIVFVNQWAFVIFLSAADGELLRPFLSPLPLTVISIIAVMIVRMYAMWNQSKRILSLLLFIYVPQVIIAIVLTAVLNTSKYLTGVSCINLTWHFSLIRVISHPLHLSVQLQLAKFWICLHAIPDGRTYQTECRCIK